MAQPEPTVGGATRGQTGPVCPECGTPTSVRESIRPWWHRRRGLVQLVAVVAVLLWMGWRSWEAWPAAPPPRTLPPGMLSVEFPPTGFSHADVELLAERGTGDSLVDALGLVLDYALPGTEITAAFVEPIGYVSEFRRYGWPVDLIVYRYDTGYQDVYARTGAAPVTLRGSRGWQGLTESRERLDALGRRENRLLLLGALGPIAVVLIAAWTLGQLVRRVCCLAGLVHRGATRRRDRFAQRLPEVALLGALVLTVGLSIRPREEVSAILPNPWMPPTAPTGLRTEQLLGLRGSADADRQVARAILEATSTLTPTGDTLLFGWSSPTTVNQMQRSGAWPAGLFYDTVVSRPGSEASPLWLRALRLERGGLLLTWRSEPPAARTRSLTVQLTRLTGPVLALWGVAVGVGLALRVGWWYLRRRAAGRGRRGQCVRCAYDIRLRGASEGKASGAPEPG